MLTALIRFVWYVNAIFNLLFFFTLDAYICMPIIEGFISSDNPYITDMEST